MCGGCGRWDMETRERVVRDLEPGDRLVSATEAEAEALVKDGRCVEVAPGLLRCR